MRVDYPINKIPTQSLQENAITVFWPRLYNSLPKYLRDIESAKTEKLKFEFDRFLELISDVPKNAQLCLRNKKQQHYCQDVSSEGSRNLPRIEVESPTRPRSRLSCFETYSTYPSKWVAIVGSVVWTGRNVKRLQLEKYCAEACIIRISVGQTKLLVFAKRSWPIIRLSSCDHAWKRKEKEKMFMIFLYVYQGKCLLMYFNKCVLKIIYLLWSLLRTNR